MTQGRNVGLDRNQVHDGNTLGIFGSVHASKSPAQQSSERAVSGGAGARCRSTVVMTAPAPIPFGIDELAIAGALRGKPLELVTCKTIPLEVPASAEIIIEGEILPDELQEEGPLGNSPGTRRAQGAAAGHSG